MRDAYGGVANLVIIVVFLALVSGFLAFNVNYTKAFRVKNKIITTFEQYEGNCDFGTTARGTCNGEIKAYMDSLGYNAPYLNLSNSDPSYTCGYGYCYKKISVDKPTSASENDTRDRAYFKIVTQINIDIPVINRILPGLRIFQVTGDTKQIILVS